MVVIMNRDKVKGFAAPVVLSIVAHSNSDGFVAFQQLRDISCSRANKSSVSIITRVHWTTQITCSATILINMTLIETLMRFAIADSTKSSTWNGRIIATTGRHTKIIGTIIPRLLLPVVSSTSIEKTNANDILLTIQMRIGFLNRCACVNIWKQT